MLLSLAALIAFIARQAGTAQASESAQQVTYVTARGVVEPRLDAPVIAGQPAALKAFDTAMRRDVLQGSLVRVNLWNADGKIVYSYEPRLIGATFPLGPAETEALRIQGSNESEVSDLSQPENRFEIPHRKLLEVYVGVRGTNGEPMLFEAYFQYQAVTEAGAAWQRFAPPSLGQVPAVAPAPGQKQGWDQRQRLPAQCRSQLSTPYGGRFAGDKVIPASIAFTSTAF